MFKFQPLRRFLRVITSASTISLLLGCSSYSIQPVGDVAGIVLTEDYVEGEKILLQAGIYRANYQDDDGIYYEAPFTLDEKYTFNRSTRGGLYITEQGYRLYHVGRTYGGGIYGTNFGDFVLSKKLDDAIEGHIQLKVNK